MDLVVLPDDGDVGTPALLPTAVRDALPRLFVESTMPLTLIDAEGRLLAVNSSFCALVGRHAGVLGGTRLGDLIHADDRVAHLSAWRSLLGGISHADRAETRLVRPDGTEVPVVVYRTVVATGTHRSGPVGLAAVHDESSIRADRSRTQRLAILTQDVATALADADQVGDVVTRAAADLIGDGAWVWENEETGRLRLRGSWHRDPARRESLDAILSGPVSTTAAAAMRATGHGRLVHVRGAALTAGTDPLVAAWSGYAEHFGLRGLLLVPMQVRERVVGVLGLVADGGGSAYDDDSLELAGSFAGIAALGLHNALLLARSRSDGKLARAVLDAIPAMAAVLDLEGRVVDVNAAWSRAWPDHGVASIGLGASYLDVCDNAAATGMAGAMDVALGVREVLAGDRSEFTADWAFRRSDGEEVWFHVHAARLQVDERAGLTPAVVVGHHDITDRKRLEVRLAHEATHDPLTNLPNRTLLADRIDQALVRDRRAGVRTAVLFCDLDEFKAINDNYGHDGGDAVLRAVARRFGGTVRASDTVARIGGDEFVVLIESITDVDEALLVADKLVLSLREPDRPQDPGEPPLPGVSVGVAISTNSSTADALLREADAAMYAAKQSGRGRVQVAGNPAD